MGRKGAGKGGRWQGRKKHVWQLSRHRRGKELASKAAKGTMGKGQEENANGLLKRAGRPRDRRRRSKQSLIDINVVDQELPKGTSKIGQIPPEIKVSSRPTLPRIFKAFCFSPAWNLKTRVAMAENDLQGAREIDSAKGSRLSISLRFWSQPGKSMVPPGSCISA